MRRPVASSPSPLLAIPLVAAAWSAMPRAARAQQAAGRYVDSFADNSGGWDLGDEGSIGGGALTIKAGERVRLVERYAQLGPLDSIVVQERYVGGGGDPRTRPDLAVLAFDVQDPENYYFVGINREGAYTVMAVEKGVPRKLCDWTKAPALAKGDRPNLVRLDVQPALGTRELVLTINGTPMPLVVDSTPTLPDAGDVGLGAQNGTFAFSSLEIDAAPGLAATFTDRFEDASGGWIGAGDAPVAPQGGALRIDGRGSAGFALVRRPSGYDAQPGWLATQVAWDSGPPEGKQGGKQGGVGLAFAVTNSDTFYAFLVNPESGKLSVQAFVGGVAHEILPWTSSALLRRGGPGAPPAGPPGAPPGASPGAPPGAPIELGVVPVAGDGGFLITLFIDGVRVGVVPDESSRPLVTDYGLVAVNAAGTFARFTANGPSAPAPLFPLTKRDLVDTFGSNAMAWSLAPPSVRIEDHELVLDARDGERFARPNVPLPLTPTQIDLDAAWAGGSPNGAVGLLFDVVDSDSFYLFAVAGRGAWEVTRFDHGKPAAVEKWALSPAITPRGRNVLSVRVEPGSGATAKLELLVNGHSLGTVSETAPRFFCGDAGFCSSVAGAAAEKAIGRFAAIRFQGSGIPERFAHPQGAPASAPASVPVSAQRATAAMPARRAKRR